MSGPDGKGRGFRGGGTWLMVLLCLLGGVLSGGSRNLPEAQREQKSWWLTVDTLADDGSLSACTEAPEDCSLRGAINRANRRSGSDVIYLRAGVYNLKGYPGEDENEGGDLDVLVEGGSLSIYGEGPEETVISGGGFDRIFHIPDQGEVITLSLNGLTVKDGYGGDITNGGGINVAGNLYLENVVVSGCRAKHGGGIYQAHGGVGGELVMKDVSVIGNLAVLDGGGVYANGTSAVVTGSTFVGNKALRRGGGLYNDTTLYLESSTVYKNDAPQGGGLLNWGFVGDNREAWITNSTFSLNSSAVFNYVNGVYDPLTKATAYLNNTILANSTRGENCEEEEKNKGVSEFKDLGANLDSGETCKFGKGLISQFGADPKLGELQDNGGPTDTLALLEGSPAIDRGDPSSCLHRDQRGLGSVGVCDVGAYEYNASPVMVGRVGKNRISVGDLKGDELWVRLANAYGNPLVGWKVNFEGDGVSFSKGRVMSDSNGEVMTGAATTDVGTHTVTASVGGGEGVKFTIGEWGTTVAGNYGKLNILPSTGFAADRVTALKAQPRGKGYASSGGMELGVEKLGLEVEIVGVPQQKEGGWELNWLGERAGYLEGTAFPTWKGNSVITGHAVLPNGKGGPFGRIGELGWGDKVTVKAWGETYVYEVREVKEVNAGEVSKVFRHEDEAWLTLLTCKEYDEASGTYRKRTLVRAALIKVE